MTKLSKHFSQSEFECRCSCKTEVIVSNKLLKLLEKMRLSVGGPLEITSGARCERHNSMVGGAKSSWHIPRDHVLYAADVAYWDGSIIGKASIMELYVLADKYRATGLGLYPRWVHVDKRPAQRARWVDEDWRWTNAT